jgi:hypothetical protein
MQQPSDPGSDFPVSPLVKETLSFLGVQIRGEQEWEDGLCRILDEMEEEGLLILRDPRSRIVITDADVRIVWAYFPIHRRRWIIKFIPVSPETRVLIVISSVAVEREPTAVFEKELRHHFGHTLLYLQHPKWRNECEDANRAWKKFSKGQSSCS